MAKLEVLKKLEVMSTIPEALFVVNWRIFTNGLGKLHLWGSYLTHRIVKEEWKNEEEDIIINLYTPS